MTIAFKHLTFLFLLMISISVVRSASLCKPTNCRVPVGTKSGEYCGSESRNFACIHDHVYQCNPSGTCCDEGYSDSCDQ